MNAAFERENVRFRRKLTGSLADKYFELLILVDQTHSSDDEDRTWK